MYMKVKVVFMDFTLPLFQKWFHSYFSQTALHPRRWLLDERQMPALQKLCRSIYTIAVLTEISSMNGYSVDLS